ncbi:MAG: class E sortase [Kineosporiaceae bacterium]
MTVTAAPEHGPRRDRRPRRGPSAGDAVRGVVGTFGELSITLGVLLLLFVAWQLWWTDVEANREQDRLADRLEQDWAAGEGTAPAPPAEPAVPGPDEIPVAAGAAAGEPFGLLRIPRFGDGYARPIVSGTTGDDLQQGVGHYDGSAWPGAVGNLALAGHRTTYGAPLARIDELRPGDPVVVQTAEGYYTYRITESRIVLPQQVEVVAPVPGEPGTAPTERVITMTSCHPRYSARERYVVHGVLDEFRPATEGPPAVVAAG